MKKAKLKKKLKEWREYAKDLERENEELSEALKKANCGKITVIKV